MMSELSIFQLIIQVRVSRIGTSVTLSLSVTGVLLNPSISCFYYSSSYHPSLHHLKFKINWGEMIVPKLMPQSKALLPHHLPQHLINERENGRLLISPHL
jgi:hypothetical protein